MRRERVADGVLAAALVPLSLFVALPFRAEAMARTSVSSLGWDAALHAAEGLDLFDDLRLLRPRDALGLLASRHWWGPLWALVSAPFQAAFGPSLSGTRCHAIWSGASASGFNLVEDQERIPAAPRFQTACSVTRKGLP